MSRGIDHNHLLMQQQVMRHIGLERAKKTIPNKKNDIKFLFITIGTIILICGTLLLIPIILS